MSEFFWLRVNDPSLNTSPLLAATPTNAPSIHTTVLQNTNSVWLWAPDASSSDISGPSA